MNRTDTVFDLIQIDAPLDGEKTAEKKVVEVFAPDQTVTPMSDASAFKRDHGGDRDDLADEIARVLRPYEHSRRCRGSG